MEKTNPTQEQVILERVQELEKLYNKHAEAIRKIVLKNPKILPRSLDIGKSEKRSLDISDPRNTMGWFTKDTLLSQLKNINPLKLNEIISGLTFFGLLMYEQVNGKDWYKIDFEPARRQQRIQAIIQIKKNQKTLLESDIDLLIKIGDNLA